MISPLLVVILKNSLGDNLMKVLFFQEFLDFNYTTICSEMLCRDTSSTAGGCSYALPFEGSSCGNGKVSVLFIM